MPSLASDTAQATVKNRIQVNSLSVQLTQEVDYGFGNTLAYN